MDIKEVFVDAFGRIGDVLHDAVEGLDPDDLAFRPDAQANSIGWLGWHLTRVQDDHVSEITGREQAWIAEGWHARFGMAPDPSETGFGHTSKQVARIRPENPELILSYYAAVAERTLEYLATVDAAELDRIIDRSYDPPVSV